MPHRLIIVFILTCRLPRVLQITYAKKASTHIIVHECLVFFVVIKLLLHNFSCSAVTHSEDVNALLRFRESLAVDVIAGNHDCRLTVAAAALYALYARRGRTRGERLFLAVEGLVLRRGNEGNVVVGRPVVESCQRLVHQLLPCAHYVHRLRHCVGRHCRRLCAARSLRA